MKVTKLLSEMEALARMGLDVAFDVPTKNPLETWARQFVVEDHTATKAAGLSLNPTRARMQSMS